ncbi:hypothetical protein EVAR_90237_1 [Eumeta japonica]|uniref:Uncharacterized protein n=1 Tax=Eumeta variegata TaxID=151549 RepID=A0A4C1YME6_EUMVA|nr:hypothetical protein EVAR_90237_1 [Eumeta japonica]
MRNGFSREFLYLSIIYNFTPLRVVWASQIKRLQISLLVELDMTSYLHGTRIVLPTLEGHLSAAVSHANKSLLDRPPSTDYATCLGFDIRSIHKEAHRNANVQL